MVSGATLPTFILYFPATAAALSPEYSCDADA